MAYSRHLNLIATVSRREVAGPDRGGNSLLLWSYDKVNPLGACATPGFARGLEEVNDMVFLEPYPALLVVDVQVCVSVRSSMDVLGFSLFLRED